MKSIVSLCLALCLLFGNAVCQAQQFAFNSSANTGFEGSASSKKVPIYAGLGVVMLAGTGLMVGGLTQRTDALDNKNLFNTYTNPSDNFYLELGQSRDELEESYKKDLKKSNLLIYGGAAVVAIGAGILINRIAWMKRIERSKATRSGFAPNPTMPPFTIICASSSGGAGIGLVYHF